MVNKKLYSININSLNILDVLLREKNITATGKILSLSQAAVSIALRNLRDIFGDALLVKIPRKKQMELTPFALTLREPLKRVIEEIEKIVFNSDAQISSPSRTLRLALTDAVLMLFVPKLLKKLQALYPKVTIDIYNLFHKTYVNQLNEGSIDIAAGAFSTQHEPNSIYYKFLIKDQIICTAKRGHPILKKEKITLDEYRQYPKILSKFIKSPYDITNEMAIENPHISGKEIDSNNSLPIYATLGSVPVLMETNRIALCGSLVYKKAAEYFDVGYTRPDFKVSTIDYSICCLKRYKNDPVIKTIFDIFSKIAQEYSPLI